MHEMEVREHEEVERLKLKYGLVEKLGDDEKSEGGGDMTDNSTSAAEMSVVVRDEGNDNKIERTRLLSLRRKVVRKANMNYYHLIKNYV